jgi:putative ABC transport system permease protein
MAAAMASMIWQRRARLTQLQLDGLNDLDVWRTLLLETTLLAGLGCLMGALFGLGGQLLGSRAILAVTGFPVEFSFGLPLAIASLVVVTGVAVAVTAIPGYLVARMKPVVGVSG